MTRFELIRWLRSRRLLVLLAVFAFSGITSPLMSAFAEEIFGALATADNLQVVIQEPTWQDGLGSYLQNSSQLALVFACYLAAWACSLGTDDRVRIYYRSRAERSREVFGPRLLVTGAFVVVATVVGASIALYEVVVLFDNVEVIRAFQVLAVQAAGLTLVALLAACVAVVTNSPALSTAIVYGTVFIADLFRSAEAIERWSPTVLVRPTPMLEADGSANVVIAPMVVGAVVLGAALTGVLLRRLRVALPAPRTDEAVAPGPDTAGPPAEIEDVGANPDVAGRRSVTGAPAATATTDVPRADLTPDPASDPDAPRMDDPRTPARLRSTT